MSIVAVPPFKLPVPETFPNTLKTSDASKAPSIFTPEAVSASPTVTLPPGWNVCPEGTYRETSFRSPTVNAPADTE
ncbi:hypothetical protein ES703_90765 [subsurface metagenome]